MIYLQKPAWSRRKAVLAAAGLPLALHTASATAQSASGQPIAGVWIAGPQHNRFWQSPASMREHMAAFKRGGRNTVYLACFNHGRSYWPSRLMQEVLGDGENGLIAPEFKGRDPLAEAIEAGAAHGIRVFAWLEFGFASHHRYSPYERTLLKVNPSWAALNREGKPVVKNDFHWMNAFEPAVQGLLLSLCVELARNYPGLAGVQGDDRLPAQPVEGGYHEAVLAAFAKTNPSAAGLPADKDPAWVRFRGGLLTAWLGELRAAIKAARANCELSLAPSAYPFALFEYLQD